MLPHLTMNITSLQQSRIVLFSLQMAIALTSRFTLIVRGRLLPIFLDCLFLCGDDHGPGGVVDEEVQEEAG